MIQRFTTEARRIISYGQEEAYKVNADELETEHLLLGLMRDADCIAVRVFERRKISVESLRETVLTQIEQKERRTDKPLRLSPESKRIIDHAYTEARQFKHSDISPEHLLLGLLREGKGKAGRVLAEKGVELKAVRELISVLRSKNSG